MTIHDHRIQHIKDREEEIRKNLGKEITIKLIAGIEYPPGSVWNEIYQKWTDASGNPVEGTPTYTTHKIPVVVKWITEEMIYETKVGLLKQGDCVLDASIDWEVVFEQAIKEQAVVIINNYIMILVDMARGRLGTNLKVAATRTK